MGFRTFSIQDLRLAGQKGGLREAGALWDSKGERKAQELEHGNKLGGTPNPVIVTIRDKGKYIRVLSYSYYITIAGWGSSQEIGETFPLCSSKSFVAFALNLFLPALFPVTFFMPTT